MSYQIFLYKKIILYPRKGLTQVATNIRVDFHRSNMRENRHPLRLHGIGTFPPTPYSVPDPLSSTPSQRSMPTSDDSTHCTAPPLKTYSLALTARRGCYGDHYPHTYAHSAPPTTPASRRRRRSTTKSVTPTFQVDDLHCIVDARARDGPHLDSELTPLPFPLADVDRPTATPVRSRGCSRRRRRRRDVERVENGPDRGLSLLETEDCLAGYSELLGGVPFEGLYFDCIVAVFLLSSVFSFFPSLLPLREGWDKCILYFESKSTKLWMNWSRFVADFRV